MSPAVGGQLCAPRKSPCCKHKHRPPRHVSISPTTPLPPNRCPPLQSGAARRWKRPKWSCPAAQVGKCGLLHEGGLGVRWGALPALLSRGEFLGWQLSSPLPSMLTSRSLPVHCLHFTNVCRRN